MLEINTPNFDFSQTEEFTMGSYPCSHLNICDIFVTFGGIFALSPG